MSDPGSQLQFTLTQNARKMAWQSTIFEVTVLAVVVLSMIFINRRAGDASLGPHPQVIAAIAVLGLVITAIRLFLRLRAPWRVLLDDDVLTVESLVSTKRFSWNEISNVEQDWAVPAGYRRTRNYIRLYGGSGKRLIIISGELDLLIELDLEISKRSTAATGRATFDPVQDEMRRAWRMARRAWYATVGFGIGTLVTGAGLWAIRTERSQSNKPHFSDWDLHRITIGVGIFAVLFVLAMLGAIVQTRMARNASKALNEEQNRASN